jgi:glycosyltransferase involved in cell wall biosynthesis
MGLDPAKRIRKQVATPFAVREGERSFINKLEAFVKGIILYPNTKRGWCPHAIKAGTELLQNEKIDAIISSSPPETTHLVAEELKSRFGVSWIADFRDLWTQFHYYRHSSVRKWFERRLEIKTLSQADALVAVSEPWAGKLESVHPGKKAFVIPNGFDPDEVKSSPLSKEFTITYTGRVYRGKQDTSPLFQVVRELMDEGLFDPAVVRIRFFGPVRYWIEQEIKQYELGTVARQYGVVSRETILTKQRESQILLLLDWNDPDEQGVYPAKVFEYLAAKRPVLAAGGGEGVIKELIEKTNVGTHVSDLASLKSVLVKYYNEYKATGKVVYRGKEEVNKCGQDEMARKYSEVLDSVTA